MYTVYVSKNNHFEVEDFFVAMSYLTNGWAVRLYEDTKLIVRMSYSTHGQGNS